MPTPAQPNERGWKDTFIMYPGEVTTVIARWAPTDAGATGDNYFAFNPNGGHGYVWHCHIIDHEDNEMMRPYLVNANGPDRINEPIYAGYWSSHPFGAPKLAGGGNPVSDILPESFALNQNFPNPFNANTKIAFSLPEAANVNLEIYNVNGQLVESFSDHLVAGNHYVDWDASEASSGVYFYKVSANGHSMVKRMTLIK